MGFFVRFFVGEGGNVMCRGMEMDGLIIEQGWGFWSEGLRLKKDVRFQSVKHRFPAVEHSAASVRLHSFKWYGIAASKWMQKIHFRSGPLPDTDVKHLNFFFVRTRFLSMKIFLGLLSHHNISEIQPD